MRFRNNSRAATRRSGSTFRTLGVLATVAASAAVGLQVQAGSAGAATKKPVTILQTVSVNSTVVSTPDFLAGMQAAVTYMNAHGGLHGHHINFTFCDSKFTPNLELACARKAASEHAIAILGSDVDNNPTTFAQIVTQAGIANIAPIAASTAEFVAPTYFELWIGPAQYGSAGYAMAKHGCKTATGIVLNVPVANTNASYGAQGVVIGGAKTAPTVEIPATSPNNFSPAIQQATSGSITCLMPIFIKTQYAPYFQAIQSGGSKVRSFLPYMGFNPETLTQIGASQANGVNLVNIYTAPSKTTKTPSMKAFMGAMAKYQPKTTPDPEAENSWVSMMILTKATAGLTNFTSATVLKAMNKASKVNVGFGVPTLNFTKPNPLPAYKRVFDTTYHLAVVQGTTPKELKTTINMQPVLAKIKTGTS